MQYQSQLTEDVDSCGSSQNQINDSRKNVSVVSAKEVEPVERISQFYISTASGDCDAVKETRQEANSLNLKSMECQPQLTQTVTTNSDEDSTQILQVYQDDPNTNRGEYSEWNKARFLLRINRTHGMWLETKK